MTKCSTCHTPTKSRVKCEVCHSRNCLDCTYVNPNGQKVCKECMEKEVAKQGVRK
jgi:hypothetical protein